MTHIVDSVDTKSMPNWLIAVPIFVVATEIQTAIAGLLLHRRKSKIDMILRQVLKLRRVTFFSDFCADLLTFMSNEHHK